MPIKIFFKNLHYLYNWDQNSFQREEMQNPFAEGWPTGGACSAGRREWKVSPEGPKAAGPEGSDTFLTPAPKYSTSSS